ncbi:MAG: DUF6036 family nucleotidyltransferase [Bacteroidales bacterium]|nr:DUF6036 family nucleotidyltransferase [Bacteroidales bacterium]
MENFFNNQILRFVEACNSYNIRMLLVGGVAVNYYGYKRHSADIDFWIDPSPENMKRMLNAFKSMGFKIESWPQEVLDQKQNISVKISPGLELELLTNFNPGVSFDEAYKKSVIIKKGTQKTIQWNVIAFEDLINSKISSGRAKDKLDIQVLQKIKNNSQ